MLLLAGPAKQPDDLVPLNGHDGVDKVHPTTGAIGNDFFGNFGGHELLPGRDRAYAASFRLLLLDWCRFWAESTAFRMRRDRGVTSRSSSSRMKLMACSRVMG